VFGREPGEITNIVQVQTREEAAQACKRLREDRFAPGAVGIDGEFVTHGTQYQNWTFQQFRSPKVLKDSCGPFARLLQIARADGTVFLFDLFLFEKLPRCLFELLKDETMARFSHHIKADINAIVNVFGDKELIEPCWFHDLYNKIEKEQNKCSQRPERQPKVNLTCRKLGQVFQYEFGVKLPNKEAKIWDGQEYNVAYAGLSEEQLQYAARDAVATLDIGLEWARRKVFPSTIVKINEVFRKDENHSDALMEYKNFEINLTPGFDNLVVMLSNDVQPEDPEPLQQDSADLPLVVPDATSHVAPPVAAPAVATSPSTIPKSSVLGAGSVIDPGAQADLPYRWWMTDSTYQELSRDLPKVVNLPVTQASLVRETAKEFYRSWKRIYLEDHVHWNAYAADFYHRERNAFAKKFRGHESSMAQYLKKLMLLIVYRGWTCREIKVFQAAKVLGRDPVSLGEALKALQGPPSHPTHRQGAVLAPFTVALVAPSTVALMAPSTVTLVAFSTRALVAPVTVALVELSKLALVAHFREPLVAPFLNAMAPFPPGVPVVLLLPAERGTLLLSFPLSAARLPDIHAAVPLYQLRGARPAWRLVPGASMTPRLVNARTLSTRPAARPFSSHPRVVFLQPAAATSLLQRMSAPRSLLAAAL